MHKIWLLFHIIYYQLVWFIMDLGDFLKRLSSLKTEYAISHKKELKDISDLEQFVKSKMGIPQNRALKSLKGLNF